MIGGLLMAKIRSDLDQWEGFFPWMYLDSVGLVTIGYGTMLPTADFASEIAFYHDETSAVATTAEIVAGWNDLTADSATQNAAANKDKHAAKFYKDKSDLRITQQTASDLRDTHILQDYSQLGLIYQSFDDLPDPAKQALFDMIYNLGAGRSAVAAKAATKGHKAISAHKATGLRAYASMNAAIKATDWQSAAATCRRKGIPPERNQMTAALFRSCIKLQDVNH